MSTDSNILTDTFLFVVSTSVTIPLKYPVNNDVEPDPAITVFGGIDWVIPNPTCIFEGNEPNVNTWSAKSSIMATFRLFAHEPGFLAATVTPVIVDPSYPRSL